MSESREDRAERIVAELRAVTSEAAGTLKDLTRAMKEAREHIDAYAMDQLRERLDAAAATGVQLLTSENDRFIRDFAAARKAACEEAEAHLREDWRLAVAVNEVGRHVHQAMTQAYGHPIDCACELPMPRQVSTAYMAGETPPGHPE